MPWVQEGLRILDETLSGEAVASYFNKVGMQAETSNREEKMSGAYSK